MRAFIAIELSEEARKEIERIARKIKERELIRAKFVERENLHLTLRFLRDISKKQEGMIREALRGIAFDKFDVKLAKLGFFPNEKFVRILWLSLQGKGVYELKEEIDKVLADLVVGDKRFSSHVTIARVKSIIDKKNFFELIKNINVKPIEFIVDEFVLKSSTLTEKGPVYEDIESFNLK